MTNAHVVQDRLRSLSTAMFFRRGVLLLEAILISALSPAMAQATDSASPRERLSFNADWRFQKGDPAEVQGRLEYAKIREWVVATGPEFLDAAAVKPGRPDGNPVDNVEYVQIGFNDGGWRRLNLPHDWGVEGPFKQEYPGDTGKLPWWGVAWYRKHFSVPSADQGKCFYLDVDGAMAYAAVWLNGQFVGGWPYGYSSFRLDLTPFLRYGGENVIAVRLDNPQESSRWYPGGGMYRNVWLVKTDPVHVGQWGTFVTTPRVSPAFATVDVKTTIDNRSAADAAVQVSTRIHEIDSQGRYAADAAASAAPLAVKIPKGRQSLCSQSLNVGNPKLWSLRKPQQYAAVTTLEKDGAVLDRTTTVFGIRTYLVDPNNGFILNGQPVRLNGVCDHHDLGPLGTAVNTRALERQIELLQEMGCNAIRTSHNPPAPELLDLCDRMGMLVMDEAFDCWRTGKKKNDYHLLFADWHEKDLRALVRRDRNHPSVVLWSIGNEIREQGEPEGWKLAAHLAGIVREEDRTRPVTAGFNNRESGYNGFHTAVDIVGYNYKPDEYGIFHQRNSWIPVIGSETASCVSSRGEYFFPVSDNKADGRVDFQVSSYDLYAPRWAWPPDVEFKGLDEFPFTGGEFVWTGFDYLGEPTPYNGDSSNLLNFTDPVEQARMSKELKELGKIKVPSRSSYFGIFDLCGFKKDRFYIYQARWRPELPMAHILPHWNWPERVGQITPVHVYTSGDEAELFLNGASLGRKKREPFQYRFRWDDVRYAPGELRVEVYRNGQKWAEAASLTAGPAARILLQTDRNGIRADGQDLAFVTVTIADKGGQPVPRSKNRLRFEISGPGEIAALDNGDATSFEPMQGKSHRAYNGLCLAIVRASNRPGTIRLVARAEGLKEASVQIQTQAVNTSPDP